MSEPRFQPLEMLRVLSRHGVRFVLIGGLGARAWGSPMVTGDMDICYARDESNRLRLASALQELDARLRGVDEPVPFLLDDRTLEMGDAFTFVTRAGNLDIMKTPLGVPKGFEELDRNAVSMDLDGFSVRVASLTDLMRMKRAAARPKDLLALEELGAIVERMDLEDRERRDRASRDEPDDAPTA